MIRELEWAFQSSALIMQLSTQTHEDFTVKQIFPSVIRLLQKAAMNLKNIELHTIPSPSNMSAKMTCLLQVLASVCISLIEEYALTLCAHMLSQIIVSINSLWPKFTGCSKFIISWQFAGWQEAE